MFTNETATSPVASILALTAPKAGTAPARANATFTLVAEGAPPPAGTVDLPIDSGLIETPIEPLQALPAKTVVVPQGVASAPLMRSRIDTEGDVAAAEMPLPVAEGPIKTRPEVTVPVASPEGPRTSVALPPKATNDPRPALPPNAATPSLPDQVNPIARQVPQAPTIASESVGRSSVPDGPVADPTANPSAPESDVATPAKQREATVQGSAQSAERPARSTPRPEASVSTPSAPLRGEGAGATPPAPAPANDVRATPVQAVPSSIAPPRRGTDVVPPAQGTLPERPAQVPEVVRVAPKSQSVVAKTAPPSPATPDAAQPNSAQVAPRTDAEPATTNDPPIGKDARASHPAPPSPPAPVVPAAPPPASPVSALAKATTTERDRPLPGVARKASDGVTAAPTPQTTRPEQDTTALKTPIRTEPLAEVTQLPRFADDMARVASDQLRVPTDTGTRTLDVARSVQAQIVDVVRQTSDGTVELKLAPEELGRVRMTVSQTDLDVAITVLVERGETLDLMRRHADVLSAELRQAGFERLTFSFGQGGGDPQNARQTDVGDGEPGDTPPADNDAADPEPTPTRTNTLAPGASRLDIRL